MEEVEALLCRAKGLAAGRLNAAVRRALVKLMDVVMDMLVKEAGGQEPQQEEQAKRRKTKDQQQEQLRQQQQQQQRERQQQQQHQHQHKQKQGSPKKEGQWVTVTKKPATPPKLRGEDWMVPVVSEEELLSGDSKEGVAIITQHPLKELATKLAELQNLKGGKYAAVTKRPINDTSTKTLVFYEGGFGEDWWVTLAGAAGPKNTAKSLPAATATSATTPVTCTIPLKWVTEGVKSQLADPRTSAAALDRLGRIAAQNCGVQTETRHRWGHKKLPGRVEMQVRIGTKEVTKLLERSGENGIFWRSHSWSKGGELHPVVWLKDDTTPREALPYGRRDGACGLVTSTKRLGVRILGEQHRAQVTSMVGDLALPPMEEKKGKTYVVSGALRGEHPEDIKSFAKKDRRVCIVTADVDPPCEVITRGGKSSLLLATAKREDFPKRKTASWSGPISKSSVEVEEVLPREQRKRKTPEDETMEENHEHVWGDKTVKASTTWKCSVCDTRYKEGHFYRSCECGNKVCGTCVKGETQ